MRVLVVDTPHGGTTYGGFPDYAACALVYHHARVLGVEEILVQCKGTQGHRYTMTQVRDFLTRYPEYRQLARAPTRIPLLSGVFRHAAPAAGTPM